MASNDIDVHAYYVISKTIIIVHDIISLLGTIYTMPELGFPACDSTCVVWKPTKVIYALPLIFFDHFLFCTEAKHNPFATVGLVVTADR